MITTQKGNTVDVRSVDDPRAVRITLFTASGGTEFELDEANAKEFIGEISAALELPDAPKGDIKL